MVAPPLGRELADAALRMRRHSQEDVPEVVERGQVDERAALHERIDQGGTPGALEVAREERVLGANGDDAELILCAAACSYIRPRVAVGADGDSNARTWAPARVVSAASRCQQAVTYR